MSERLAFVIDLRLDDESALGIFDRSLHSFSEHCSSELADGGEASTMKLNDRYPLTLSVVLRRDSENVKQYRLKFVEKFNRRIFKKN
jgi:hypothetical protein